MASLLVFIFAVEVAAAVVNAIGGAAINNLVRKLVPSPVHAAQVYIQGSI